LGVVAALAVACTINWTTNKGTLQSDFDWKLDQAVFNTGRVSGTVKSGLCAGQSVSGEFTTNLLGGAVQCATGPLFGRGQEHHLHG
jgi:hypothetical protein